MKILNILTGKRRLGNFGENAAARLLKKKGYKILERSFVAEGREIDIIAKNKECLVFVEVKTRDINKLSKNEARPISSVTRDKQQGIIRAAWSYIENCGRDNKHIRLDCVEVFTVKRDGKDVLHSIKHIEGAFNFNTAFGRR